MSSATESWTLSATEALARFRTKELSPVEYLEALIGRITAEDERINAVTEVVEEAVTSAREAERFYANAAADDLAEAAATRPLLGLPVIAKEKHAIAGRSLTQGLIHERRPSSARTQRSSPASARREASCMPGPPRRNSAARPSRTRRCGA
jgi:aspartyl-tRNA(Asn)/glutamyl-tRNA(Gln) amidotransferase subunit A